MVALAILAGSLAGCGDAASALGASAAGAHANADALFFALGSRFGPVIPAASYEETRSKFGRSALIPSRLYDDDEVWTTVDGEVRVLEFAGVPTDSGYVLGVRDPSGSPVRPGEYRRLTRLRGLDQNQYEWTVRDELAVGRVTPDELGAALAALFRAGEQSDPESLRDAYRGQLPRTTDVLGRLFTLDSIGSTPAPGGGTRISFQTTIDAPRIAGEYPNFSRFLERYISRTRFEFQVQDLEGITWWTASMDRDRLTLELRVRDGRLAPLAGPPRQMPDSLRVQAQVHTRVRIFGVGVSDLVGEGTVSRAANDKSFTVAFRREPNWHFPLLVERLIRAPLRRPFEGDGAVLTFAIHRSGRATALVREYRIAVQESRIVRWIGGLGSTALDDFRGDAEHELEQFIAELFLALRADAARLLSV